jgi:hypothetical protein
MDAKEALQYVYCICLSKDQGEGVGEEQVKNAWEQVQRIVIYADTGAAWEELVGGFRLDGTRFVSISYHLISHYLMDGIERGHRTSRAFALLDRR